MGKGDGIMDYYVIGCHVLWRELCYFASLTQHKFNFKFLNQGLHNTPELMRKEIQQAIDEVDGKYSHILIGYGLCSRGIEGIHADKSTLVIMKGHDCITFFLGSKEAYSEYFRRHPGTYWYTSGWIEDSLQPGKERYDKTYAEYVERYGEDNAEYLMEMEQGWFKNYNNAAYIDLGIFDAAKHKEYTKKCAEWLGWNYDELKGNSALIRDFVEGNWDRERFLVVEPGHNVMASNDNEILKIGTFSSKG
jgi:hypothetical protein